MELKEVIIHKIIAKFVLTFIELILHEYHKSGIFAKDLDFIYNYSK